MLVLGLPQAENKSHACPLPCHEIRPAARRGSHRSRQAEGRLVSAVPLLQVEALVTSFRTPRGTLRAVDGVSLSVARGQTVCIAGESGCGKSVTALSIMGLLPDVARVESGAIRFNGVDLLALPPRERRGLRGRALAMIFQEPMSSLNRRCMTIGNQIARGPGAARARFRPARSARERC